MTHLPGQGWLFPGRTGSSRSLCSSLPEACRNPDTRQRSIAFFMDSTFRNENVLQGIKVS